MPFPDIPGESYDPDVLAAQAFDEHRSEAERNQAFERLRGLVLRLATSLSIRLTGRRRDDFADGAIGEIYLRRNGFTGGSFVAWCHRTLHNWMVDALRADSRRKEHEREAARTRDEAAFVESHIDSLTLRQLDAMRTWNPGQRLALLCLSGLWREVPDGLWLEWCEAYRPGGETIINQPFPPQEFEGCPGPQQRAGVLAQLLRVRRGTLSVWVHRCVSKLQQSQEV